jgi:hypothetical protein
MARKRGHRTAAPAMFPEPGVPAADLIVNALISAALVAAIAERAKRRPSPGALRSDGPGPTKLVRMAALP